MDFETLQKLEHFLPEQSANMKVVLRDQSNGIKIIDVQGLVLFFIPHFRKLAKNSTEKLTTFELQIPCVHVGTLEALFELLTQKKIKPTINNMSPLQYRLELLLCFNYLGLSHNENILGELGDIEVPLGEVHFLFFVAHALKYNDHIVVFINDHLPEKCDLYAMPKGIKHYVHKYTNKRDSLSSSLFKRKDRLHRITNEAIITGEMMAGIGYYEFMIDGIPLRSLIPLNPNKQDPETTKQTVTA